MVCKIYFILFVVATNSLKLSKLNHITDIDTSDPLENWVCEPDIRCSEYSKNNSCSDHLQGDFTLDTCIKFAQSDGCSAVEMISYYPDNAVKHLTCQTIVGGCSHRKASNGSSICTFKNKILSDDSDDADKTDANDSNKTDADESSDADDSDDAENSSTSQDRSRNQTWGWGDLHLKDGKDGVSKNTNQTWGWGDLHETTD